MDEPLSNLDARLRIAMRSELKQLHRQLHSTVVYVTHDQAEAMTLSDRIAILRDGVLQQVDTPRAIYERPANQFVAAFMGATGMNFVPCRVISTPSGPGLARGAFHVPLSRHQESALKQAGLDEVIVGLRPEHVALAGEGEEGLQARTELVEYLGSEALVHVFVEQTRLIAKVNGDEDIAPDKSVRIRVDLSRVTLFDPNTQARISTAAGR